MHAGRTTNIASIISLLGAFLAAAVVMGLLTAGLVMPAVGAAGAATRSGVDLFDALPSAFTASVLSQQSRILDSAGNELATPYEENRVIVPLANVAQNVLMTGREAERRGNQHASIVPYQLFHASDRPFAVGVGTDRHYERLCREVLGRPDLISSRFASNAKRVQERATLIPLLEAVFRTRPASTWVRLCGKAGIPVSLVNGVREALRSSSGNALVEWIDHREIGPYQAVGNPVVIDGARRKTHTAPPALGADTDAVLGELSYTRREIAALREQGVV